MLYENNPKKKNDIFHCVIFCLIFRMTAKCAEEELNKALSTVLSAGIADLCAKKTITNAIKM